MREFISYTIQPAHPYAHIFAVTCTVVNPNPLGQRFYLPSWTPGSYKIRDFAKNISRVRAQTATQPLDCRKVNKNTWQCAPTTETITVTYEVYAWDLSVRGAHLDQTHATINGSSVFMCAIGKETLPCQLTIERPAGDTYKKWRVATAMARSENTIAYEFGEYEAANYAELIDHPIELGDFLVTSFIEQGITHELVFTGLAPHTDITRVTKDVQRITAYYLHFFPKPYPMDRYVFLIMLLDQGFGGLEHRASSYLHFSKYGLPTSCEIDVSETYSSFLTLCSHEYLHTWLVKGIKPAVFMAYDLNQENYTELLWVFEGFTAYYEDLSLVRNGLLTPSQFFTLMAHKITRLWRVPGRTVQSVTQASYDAWIKFYQPDEQTPNITVSYYLKGSLIALILDIHLRQLTDNRYSVDTLVKRLWELFATKPEGVNENALIDVIREQIGDALDPLLFQLLNTTEELPLTDTLAKIGVSLTARPARHMTDKGEINSQTVVTQETIPVDLGVIWDMRQSALVIQHCLTGSVAQQAGLSAGDVVVAMDDLRVDALTLQQHLSRYSVGDKAVLHAFRRDLLMKFDITFAAALPVAVLTINPSAPADALNLREQWLKA